MEIREFKGGDIDRVISVWNNALPCDPIDRKQFIHKLIAEPNFSPKGFFVAEENGKIMGFVNSVYRRVPVCAGAKINENEGWISAFAAESGESFNKTAELLLDAAERYLLSKGKSIISTGYAPVYFTQGFEESLCPEYVRLFKTRGYRGERSCARDICLAEYVPVPKIEEKRSALEADGFYIGALKDEYVLSLLDMNELFNNAGWSVEFKSRFMDLDYERIRIAAKDGHIVGCCVFGDAESSAERFGPFGVNPDLQGRGIGTVLLNDCLSEMKKRSLHCAWMQWTPESGAAAAVYERAGFKVTKTYLTFSKDFSRRI